MFIAVDFDGTCVEHTYPLIGGDVPDAVRVMKRLIKDGHQLMLWTMRSGRTLDDAEHWFKIHDIPLYSVQTNPNQIYWTSSPKCYAELYIDDAAFGCPLIQPEGFTRPCVDWLAVEKELLEDK